MPATAAQLARRVGLRLTIIDEGDALTTTQQTDIVQAVADLRAELLELGLCWWDADAIPDAVVGALVGWIAYEIAPAFGKEQVASWRMDGERRLNMLAPSAAVPVQTAEFF